MVRTIKIILFTTCIIADHTNSATSVKNLNSCHPSWFTETALTWFHLSQLPRAATQNYKFL